MVKLLFRAHAWWVARSTYTTYTLSISSMKEVEPIVATIKHRCSGILKRGIKGNSPLSLREIVIRVE